jgi:predicted RNase H-like HicB family nuclease
MACFRLLNRVEASNKMRAKPETAEREAEMNGYRFSVYVVRDGEGWAAACPEFTDCRARGATYEAALANLRDLIQIFVEDGLGDDEPPPQIEGLSLTTLSLQC